MIIRGQKINDRYQIVRTIGEGGMANVYLAHDLILDRDVAVKILRGDLADDEKFVRRFQREAIAASSLSHPNIVEMYDVGEDNGKYYIVMEYVEGKTLKTLVKKRGALTLPEVIDIMTQLTSAIACAHDSNIIHRDIKPQNVLIKEDGIVKITDFGIAMALNSNELTQTNSVMGSVHYLPPEQANGKGATIKSDIYSLGIVMFELLTGTLPFKGDNAVEIAIKQMKNKIPSVCDINDQIPQSVENIILKACAKNPKNRYKNVQEMYKDIETCLDEDRINEKIYVYPYSESEEIEDTKEIKNIKEIKEEKTELDEIEEKEEKKSNIVLIILSIIASLLILALMILVIVFPKIGKNKEILVPDVSNKTVAEAENELKKLGFVVSEEQEEQGSDTIEEGLVIKTNPQSGVSRKKGTAITLVISTGINGVTLENYVGSNFFEIKGKLEAYGLKVVKEEKEVEKQDDVEIKENQILEQRPIAGTKLVKDDTVTFVVPNLIVNYPNFIEEDGWSRDAIERFCEANNISVTFKEEETDTYPEGTIIKQDRVAGTRVREGYPLTITIAKKKEKVIEPEKPIENNNEETNTNNQGN